MRTPIYDLSIWMARGAILLLLLAACWFCYRPQQPGYMRSFPIYCLVNLLSELIEIRLPQQMGLDYNLFDCFEGIYFAYFFGKIIGTGRVKQLVWGLVGANLVFTLFFLARKGVHQLSGLTFLLESVALSIPCFSYFHEIFQTKRVMNLLQEPAFWMVTGTLFYMLLRIPTEMFASYFAYHDLPALGSEIYAVNNYALCVSYILYLKGMSCRTKSVFPTITTA